jgi:transcriptional regulator with XRE-family HTH domain
MGSAKSITEPTAPVREKLRQAAKDSGMTQEEIGLRMGFSKNSARKAVSRLLNGEVNHDPRLSTLLAFAKAIDMCQANGKRWNNYWQNDSTQEFLRELSSVAGIPVTGLMQVRQGGEPTSQGAWVHH